ncbi:MAG: aspartate 1-decarboxylase [Bdellovibrionaceae bacterium]|nr:aspartate 1-decarboxylase [Bdellovibrionales bacterium]MCB9253865.1 aspartate 1-decarboxylase [Pseudobdellovibrionaceae bacterium]
MLVEVLKCKIHRISVTDADLHYEGSISLGREYMECAQLRAYEKVDIYNISNGERFSTYVIPGNPGQVCLNGAAAWKVRVGDKIIIASYAWIEREAMDHHHPRVVLIGEGNQVKSVSDASMNS